MIITIDSNIASIPSLVSSKLNKAATLWCTDVNSCKGRKRRRRQHHDNTDDDSVIYYNTPLSMSDDLSQHRLPENMISFIYLDHRQINAALNRILKNISDRREDDVVIISNADIYGMGTYRMHIGNCSDSAVAEVIAALILMFKVNGTLIHPDELKQLLCSSSDTHDTYESIPATKMMSCNVYSILEYRHDKNFEIDDCKECKL